MTPSLLVVLLLVPAFAQDDPSAASAGDLVGQMRSAARGARADGSAAAPPAGTSAASPSPAASSAAPAAAAHALVLTCGDDGDLRSFTVDGRDPARGGGAGEPLRLMDSSSGSLDANRAGAYSAVEFARIAADAVKWGVDPYLALAMDVHENSAQSSVGRSGVADNDDLDWIIHPIRIYNTLNCTTRSPSGAYVNTATLTLDLDPTRSLGGASTTVKACLPDFKNPHAQSLYDINVPGSPDNALRFASNAGGVGDACCANLRMPQKLADPANASGAETMLSRFKSAVAMRTLRLMQDAAAEHGAVYAIQGWNGHGEVHTPYQSIDNRMDMKKCPLYGDDVLDVMVNMIMNNPAAVDVVREAALESGDRPVKSIFCIHAKAASESTVRIDSSQFLAAEKAYMADSSCRDSK